MLQQQDDHRWGVVRGHVDRNPLNLLGAGAERRHEDFGIDPFVLAPLAHPDLDAFFCKLAEQSVVCLIDRCPGEEVDCGALKGVQLVVDDEEFGLLVLLDRLQWAGRDDYHRIHIPALQQAKTFGFIAPRADHGHRLA